MAVQTEHLSEEREFVNALYYGVGGTGKTTNLAHLANLGRVLYVDVEAGLKLRPLRDLGITVANIERLRLGDGMSFQLLDDVFWQLKNDLDDDPASWVGVLWDSSTEIAQSLLDEIVQARVEKATSIQRQRGKATVSAAMADQFFIDRDDYKENVAKLRKLFRRFRDLPCHFGAAFLERRDQDDKTKQVTIGPSISPSIQGDVIGWHDIVCRTRYSDDDDLYLGVFRPEGVAQGKDRFGVIPRLLVDPTMDRLVSYVHGELSPADDPRQRALVQVNERQEEEEQPPQEPDGDEDEPQTEAEDAATSRPKPSALERARRAKAAQGAGKE